MWMLVLDTPLRDIKIIEPMLHRDGRGWFAEAFNARSFHEQGLPSNFVQDNQSMSQRGVLRGLHYQLGQPQGKLVRCVSGHIWDVAVDLRRTSPDFGKWAGFHLRPLTSEGKLQMLWIPEGFGHGFLVLSETAELLYKTTNHYFPKGDRSVRWNDPEIAIEWPLAELNGLEPIVSDKDAVAPLLNSAELPPSEAATQEPMHA